MARSPSPLPATPAFVQTPGERAGRFSVRGLSPDPADEKGRGSGPGIRAGDPGRGLTACGANTLARGRLARPSSEAPWAQGRGAGLRHPQTKNRDLGMRAPPRPPKAQPGRGPRSARRPRMGLRHVLEASGSGPLRFPRASGPMAPGPEHPTPLGSGPNSCRLRPGRLNGAHSRAALFLGMVFTFGWAALRGRRPSSNFFFPHSFLPSLLLPHLPFPCPRSVAQEDPAPQTNPRVQPRDPSGFACT